MMASSFDSFVDLNKKRQIHRSGAATSKRNLYDDSDSSSSSSSDEADNENVNHSGLHQQRPNDRFSVEQTSKQNAIVIDPVDYESNTSDDEDVYLDSCVAPSVGSLRSSSGGTDESDSNAIEHQFKTHDFPGKTMLPEFKPEIHPRDDIAIALVMGSKSKDDKVCRYGTPNTFDSGKVGTVNKVVEQEDSTASLRRHSTEPYVDRSWSPSRRSSSVSRKKFRNHQTLPTLDETSDQIGSSDFLDSRRQRSNSMGAEDLLGKMFGSDKAGISPLLSSSRRKLTQKPKKPTRLQKVRELQAVASDLAQRGDEDEAIKVYRRALQVAGTEVSKINTQINKQQEKHLFQSKFSSGTGSPLPIAAIKSIQNRIQEDLLIMSERIGRIRLVMAVLYERIGDHENALKCCTEAIDVYKHQQLLKVDDKDVTADGDVMDLSSGSVVDGHRTPSTSNNKNAKERLKEATTVLQRLRGARELLDMRKKSIDEMTKIRNEINLIDSSISKNPDISASAKKKRDEFYAILYEVALQQLKRESSALGKSHPQVVDVLLLLSSLAEERHLMNDALQYLNQSLKVYLSAFGKKHHKTATVYIKIARLHRTMHYHQISDSMNEETNHEDLTLENFLLAVEVLRLSKLRPTLLGSTLNDVSIIYMKRRQFENAIAVLKEALERYEENTEALTTSVAHDLMASQSESDAGISFDSKDSSDQQTEETTSSNSSGENDYKMVCADKANSSTRNCQGNLSIEALQVWRNLGECYYQVHLYDDAKDAFANALEIQRSTRTIHDAVSELDLGIVGVEEGMLQLVDDSSIVDTLSRLGKTCVAGKRHQDAYMAHMECLELMNRLAVEEELYGNLRYDQILMRKQLLVKTLYCIANSCTELSKYEDALRYYSESIQHSRIASALSSQQDTGKIIINRQQQQLQDSAHCALCFIGIGDVHLKQEKYPEALKTYNDALKYCTTKGKIQGQHRLSELSHSNV
jgi:tetratricopeptide (TPR) repeat protein